MAKIKETIYIVTVSEMLKNGEDGVEHNHSVDFSVALEEVAQELAGSRFLVEVQKA